MMRQRGVALALEGRLRGDQLMRAVGGDEVDDRHRVLEVVGEVDPAVVGPQLRVVARHLVELAPRRVERRHAGVAAARQVDGREVERQAEQVVAQRAGDELVDLVADLAGHATDDRAGRLRRRPRRAAVRNSVGFRKPWIRPMWSAVKFGVEAVDRLGQHRVAEAVDDVGELGDDRRIDRRVVALRHQEDVDVRLDLAGELLEHQVLVLHLGAELRRLEQPLAVPLQRVDGGLADRQGADVHAEPFVQEGEVALGEHDGLGVLDQPVVLGVEHHVHRGQADVLVAAAVAGDEVRVEQLVVVEAVGLHAFAVAQADLDVAVGEAGRARRYGRCRRGRRGRCALRGAGSPAPCPGRGHPARHSRGSAARRACRIRGACRPPGCSDRCTSRPAGNRRGRG